MLFEVEIFISSHIIMNIIKELFIRNLVDYFSLCIVENIVDVVVFDVFVVLVVVDFVDVVAFDVLVYHL